MIFYLPLIKLLLLLSVAYHHEEISVEYQREIIFCISGFKNGVCLIFCRIELHPEMQKGDENASCGMKLVAKCIWCAVGGNMIGEIVLFMLRRVTLDSILYISVQLELSLSVVICSRFHPSTPPPPRISYKYSTFSHAVMLKMYYNLVFSCYKIG